MSDEIVRLLRGSNSSKRLKSLKESMPVQGLKEADEEEEDIIPPAEDDIPEDDVASEEETTSAEEDTDDSEETDPEAGEVVPAEEENPNPLDNPYAVNYTIGDTVSLSFADGTKTKVSGTIEGYDKEGFYRVKWDSGKTTNGITDLALADLVVDMEEKCVCGSEEFVTEGKNLVCDKCGRIIKESIIAESKLYDIRYQYDGDELSDYAANIMVVADSPDTALQLAKENEPEGRHFSIDTTYDSVEEYKKKYPESNKKIVQEGNDHLTTADAARPKGKRLIRSEAHPMSTTIQDSIRNAFSKKKLREESEESNIFGNLEKIKGEFWTRLPELIADVEELGYDVLDANSEYIVIGKEDDEGEDHQMQIPIGGTSRTMTLDLDRAEML